MSKININKQYFGDNFNNESYENLYAKGVEALESVKNKTCKGNDFLGWVELPTNYDQVEYKRMQEASAKIQKDSDVLLVIGIGGSYLGARAVISALQNKFGNFGHGGTQVMFAGHHMSSNYTVELLEYLKDKDFSINVISKSGTTTEPAIAFRIFNELLVEKYGEEEAAKRVYATTDANKGALKELANSKGYDSYVVPDDVGGRFSVLTAVGLLPIMTAGIDTDKLMQGAQDAQNDLLNGTENNVAIEYAALRNMMLKEGKSTEILVNYESYMYFFNEWWKQLYGESEGKENKGLFPAACIFSTDLHSLGQYIQEGQRNIFETVINFKTPKQDIILKENAEDLDGLNYLAGKTLNEVNNIAMQATATAHNEGGTPNIILDTETIDAHTIGYLIYFFEIACAISGIILEVNPFDQPGVEAYKSEMFKMLGKPGN